MRITSTTYWAWCGCPVSSTSARRHASSVSSTGGSPMPCASCCRASSSSCTGVRTGRDRSERRRRSLRQIRFRDGSTQVYDPPRDTRDLRWIGCIDHHPACDCRGPGDDREPHRTARRGTPAEMAEQAITAVLRRSTAPPRKLLLPGAPQRPPPAHARPAHRPLIPDPIRGEALVTVQTTAPDLPAQALQLSPPRSSHPRASRSG